VLKVRWAGAGAVWAAFPPGRPLAGRPLCL